MPASLARLLLCPDHTPELQGPVVLPTCQPPDNQLLISTAVAVIDGLVVHSADSAAQQVPKLGQHALRWPPALAPHCSSAVLLALRQLCCCCGTHCAACLGLCSRVHLQTKNGKTARSPTAQEMQEKIIPAIMEGLKKNPKWQGWLAAASPTSRWTTRPCTMRP